MTDRKAMIDQFLQASDWAGWTRQPLAGDASARRYERLTSKDDSIILMDADPANGEDTRPFASIADYLSNHGLCPPAILAHDTDAGLMIISDLGQDDFAKWLRHNPQDSGTLYQAATDVLLALHKQQATMDLQQLTPAIGGNMVSILHPYYTTNPIDDLIQQTTEALTNLAPDADTLALRDYHAENLIWRPTKQGNNRVGLLDFQDAIMAPAGYDLASLIRDARRDVEPKLAEDIITYFQERAGTGPGFRAQLACLGAQRNLRILGVFARLAKTRQKPHYIDLIPRVWKNLVIDLQNPALKTLREAVQDALPLPDTNHLAKLRT